MRRDAEFQEFYEANYGRIVAMAAAVLGDRDQAEDVAAAAPGPPALPVLRRRAMRRTARRAAVSCLAVMGAVAAIVLSGFPRAGQALAASGKPGRLTQLDVPPLHRSRIYGMALTADASKLAVAWQNIPVGPVTSHISVTTLATGATRTWSSPGGGATTVSWAGDRTLAFYWDDATDDQARSGLRLLDTAAAGTNLLASRLILPASTRTATLSVLGDPLITEDGSTVLATMAAGAKTVIVSFSARTGTLQAVLTPAVSAGQSPVYCGILWTDSHGRHLITQCATTQDSIEGTHATPIHLPELIPASFIGPANAFAW